MISRSDFRRAFRKAKKLQSKGRLADAEQAYRDLAAPGVYREVVLEALSDLYLSSERTLDAAQILVALTEEVPDSLKYYARLANLVDGLGETEAAISHYARLLKRQPQLAAAHFNVALLYKKIKRYSDALAAYENAARLGIDRVEEVYSNMGVLYSEMHQADSAREMYERAIKIAPDYVPALFNLAGHFEEAGDKQKATELYHKILSIDPKHWDSLSRLAYAQKATSETDAPVGLLEDAIEATTKDALAREGLYFALGKTFDDLELYEKATAAYTAANKLGKPRSRPYDRVATERAFDQFIDLLDADWIRDATIDSTAAPIFICGMFRSGSTLLEQILAAHPLVSAGGELDFLPWLIERKLAPYPRGIKSASRKQLQQLADEYVSRLRELFPNHDFVTDKRPANFLHLGLIKALFPSAKIVHTQREPLDNCLSIYFQQLGGDVSYATDLENIAHYRQQHDRLMAHWMACFGKDIFTADYDELVHSPEPVLRRLAEYLGLEWDDGFLAFHKTNSLVKTASVWQVREGLHSRSSGRWRNYESLVENLQTIFAPIESVP